jgi:hypothetical protein
MFKRKLLFSLVAVFATLIGLGVYRYFGERGAPATAASETAPATAEVDLLARWRALALSLRDVAIGTPGELSASGEHGAGRDRVSAAPLSIEGNWLAEPGWLTDPDESLRDRRPREAKMRRTRYRQPATGERTILTSGRRIGSSDIRLPEGARARLGLDEQSRTVRALVCVNRRGRPTEVRITDGTGATDIDAAVARELLADRFRPLRSGGRAVGFCERITVVLSS